MPVPRHHDPLPPELDDAIFTHRVGRELGASRKRLRSRDLDKRVHGVRAPAGSLDELADLCLAYAARLPTECFFSHSTAAQLLGVPLPRRLERLADLHVTIPAPARAPHAHGLIGHSREVVSGDVVTTSAGVRVSSPARMWCEMARVLDLPDLVAVVDFLIHHRRRSADLRELAERLEVGDRISRPRALRLALELSDERSESRPESRLRTICVVAGLPRPAVNHELTDTVTGRGVRLDLAWPDRRFAIEYQGDHHRSPSQWRKDMTRRENLRLAGWTILELNADDLHDVQTLIARLRVALAR